MSNTEFVPAPAVQRRYSISDATLWRWLNDSAMAFPRPIVINRRRLFRRDELDAWDLTRTRRALVAA